MSGPDRRRRPITGEKLGAAYVGADTVALEKTPTPNLPVHVVLLVQNGDTYH